MCKNEVKDLIFFILTLILALFYKDVPLELQGLVGVLSGMIVMWTRIKEK